MPRISASDLPAAWSHALLGYELDAQSRGLSDRSIANRRSAIAGLAAWLEASHSITDPARVTKVHLQQAMIRAHAERAGSGPRTHYNDLKAFFAWYSDDVEVPSPMAGIPRPRDVIPPVPVLTPMQIARILAACSGRDFQSVRDSAIIQLLLESGLRRDELCQLDIEDVNLRAQELTVRKGKGGRPRAGSFGPAAGKALHRLLRVHPAGEGALFTGTTGRRLAGCTVGVILRKRGEQAGVPGLRPHQLRHSWCHYKKAGGMQDSDLMLLGGWSSPVQLQRYGASLAVERALRAGKATPVLSLVLGGRAS